MAGRPLPAHTSSADERAAVERLGVQGGGTAGDAGATAAGGGARNTMTSMEARMAGGASETAGRDMRPVGVQETPASGIGMAAGGGQRSGFGGTSLSPTAGGSEAHPTAATSGFGRAVGTITQPASGPMGGGRAMEPGSGFESGGTGGATFTGQGMTGQEAMGGGVMDPTPVDRKQGA